MVGEISMKYIAHCDEGREQSILDHLQGTAEKARDFNEILMKQEILLKFSEKVTGDIAVECYMILENTVINFNEESMEKK